MPLSPAPPPEPKTQNTEHRTQDTELRKPLAQCFHTHHLLHPVQDETSKAPLCSHFIPQSLSLLPAAAAELKARVEEAVAAALMAGEPAPVLVRDTTPAVVVLWQLLW